VAWHKGNAGDVTHDVGGKAANALGLYDMSGNAAEWCWGGMPSPGSGTIGQFEQACRGGSFLDAPAANALNTANYQTSVGIPAAYVFVPNVGATLPPYAGFRVAARP
jgi:formylglycine-generating enzyme required for sulfatase activity